MDCYLIVVNSYLMKTNSQVLTMVLTALHDMNLLYCSDLTSHYSSWYPVPQPYWLHWNSLQHSKHTPLAFPTAFAFTISLPKQIPSLYPLSSHFHFQQFYVVHPFIPINSLLKLHLLREDVNDHDILKKILLLHILSFIYCFILFHKPHNTVFYITYSLVFLLSQHFLYNLIAFFGDGNGNPLQYSCLENPMDGGAW